MYFSGMTMYFGVQLAEANLPKWSRWVVLSFVLLRLLMEVILQMEHQFTTTRDGATKLGYNPFESIASNSQLQDSIVLVSSSRNSTQVCT